MSDQKGFTRRASYGPSSPTVGTRGARTRQQIVDAALHCFTEKGFHSTPVEEIASRAEVSRATLYQYFESKEAVFIELMHESGGAMVRAMRRLEPLGPTAEGLNNLHWWLGEWAGVFDRYAPMFIEWANVNSPKAPLRSKLAEFVEFHVKRFGKVLEEGGHPAEGRATAAILTLSLFDRFNYIRHVYRPGLTDAQMHGSLTLALQIYLFPETPADVLAAGPRPIGRTTEREHERPPMPDIGPLATLPPRESIERPAPFEGLSPQAAATVRELLDAAARVFAATGYDGANIDQIVTEAGLARGTFYRYFSDKLELLIVLSNEAAAEMCPLFDEYATVFSARRDPAALRTWLGRFLAVQRRYTGVMRTWTEGFPIDAALLLPAADVIRSMGAAIRTTFGTRPYPLDRRAAGMMFAGMLEYFPNEGTGSSVEPTDAEIIEAQAQFTERVLLAPR